ncbi:MAG: DoxX family membrane protein [Myxococcota bacterium]
MIASDLAWVSLRVVYAWMFLYPAIGLIKNWSGTVDTTALLFPWKPELFALGSVAGMVIGGVMILLGVYGWMAGGYFFLFSLGGARIHYRLASQASTARLSDAASDADRQTLSGLAGLASVGHVTSAQKNFVLAAVGLFFFLMGTGPLSMTSATPFFRG